MSKRLDRAYRSGRSRDWLKTMCVLSDTLVIIDFQPGSGAVRAPLTKIYVARFDGRACYAGAVGTGLANASPRRFGSGSPVLVCLASADLDRRSSDRAVLYAFDLLFLNGEDPRKRSSRGVTGAECCLPVGDPTRDAAAVPFNLVHDCRPTGRLSTSV